MIISLVAHTGSQFVNCTVSPRDLRTPLHFSCAIGNLSITQLLVWVNFLFDSITQSYLTLKKTTYHLISV